MKDGRFAKAPQEAVASAMKLFRQFILRPLIDEKIRTITTVLGVSLGIAVVIAIQLTNASSVRGFETALETVAARRRSKSSAPAPASTRRCCRSSAWLREFGIISPVIEGSAALVDRRRQRAVAAADGGGEDPRHRHPARSAVPRLPAAGDRKRGQQADGRAGQQARRLQHAAVSRDPDQRADGRHHREARRRGATIRSGRR